MSIKTFSEFIEELELGYAEEVFPVSEEKYEDWGETASAAVVYSVNENTWTGKRNFKSKMVREVILNQPFIVEGTKKAVFTKNEKGNVVRVVFNRPRTKKLQESLRVRHGDTSPMWKAKYWACRQA